MLDRAEADDRPAPEPLRLVQDFILAPVEAPTPAEMELGERVREDFLAGDGLATIAVRYGISQPLVSAVVRRRRLAQRPGTEQEPQHFGDAQSAARWLRARGILPPAEPVDEAGLAQLRLLQAALRQLTLENNGAQPSGDPTRDLTDVAKTAHLVVTFSKAGVPTLTPSGAGAAFAIGRLLVIVFDAMRDGIWPRLKTCPGPQCLGVFYDTSRNRTATWCSMAVCGNRTKVRKYQERRKSKAAGDR